MHAVCTKFGVDSLSRFPFIARTITRQTDKPTNTTERSKPPVSVSAMVSDLGWEPLQTRRLHSRLTMMNKITNGLVEFPQEYHPVPRPQNSARGHRRQFQRFQPTVDAFKYALLPRTIPAWNALLQAVAEADSLDIFKRHMSRHLQF